MDMFQERLVWVWLVMDSTLREILRDECLGGFPPITAVRLESSLPIPITKERTRETRILPCNIADSIDSLSLQINDALVAIIGIILEQQSAFLVK